MTTDRTKPRPRKCLIVLTDDEWRALRVAAAEDDTTMQGWLTNVVLAAIQARAKRTPKREAAAERLRALDKIGALPADEAADIRALLR